MTNKVTSGGRAKVPPYAPYSAMKEFLERIKTISPPRIDIGFLQTYGLAPKSEWALISALKYLNIIDSEGIPTDKFRLLQTRGEELKRNLGDTIREAYSELLNVVDLETATPEIIHNYFLAQGVKAGVAGKCTGFFISIAREAGMALSPELESPVRAPKGKPPVTVRAPKRKALKLQRETAEEKEKPIVEAGRELTLLEAKSRLLERLPAFDSNWDSEAIKEVISGFHTLIDRLEGEGETTGKEED